jgi:hypothetical protein
MAHQPEGGPGTARLPVRALVELGIKKEGLRLKAGSLFQLSTSKCEENAPIKLPDFGSE